MQDYSKGTVRLHFANAEKLAFRIGVLSVIVCLRTLPLVGLGPKLFF